MGIVSSMICKLHCENCDIEEQRVIPDSMPDSGGPNVRPRPEFTVFRTQWQECDDAGPHLLSAICTRCGTEASAESEVWRSLVPG